MRAPTLTPRTDAAECEIYPSADPNYDGPSRWVEAHFARQLERELAEANALHVSASNNAHMHYQNSGKWKDRAETAEAELARTREALAELVRLEDVHKRIQHDAMEPRERDALKDEHERCIASAWEAARAVTRGTRSSPLR